MAESRMWLWAIPILLAVIHTSNAFNAEDYKEMDTLIEKKILQSKYEDPHTCAYINKEEHCTIPVLAKECANLCFKAEDLPTCSYINVSLHCHLENVANECPVKCNKVPLPEAEILKDSDMCGSVNRDTACNTPALMEMCPILCNNASCASECTNGVCSGPDICTCWDGWQGELCNEPVCEPACGDYQNCAAPGQCKCKDGWHGINCQYASCVPECVNGDCLEPNKCECKPGWKGDRCEEPKCDPACTNGGVCAAPAVCTCQPGWHGNTCQYYAYCPSGFFQVKNPAACYRFYPDERMTWSAAVSFCAANNLRLAQPEDRDAVALRSYLVDTYGDRKTAWLGARGDSHRMAYRVGGGSVGASNPLWYPDQGRRVDTDRCLGLLSTEYWIDLHPGTPYAAWSCSHIYRPLCEALP